MRTSRLAFVIALCIAAAPRLQAAGGAQVKWRSIAEGEAESKKSGKPVLYFMTAEWCGPCHTMRDEVFSDPKVVSLVNREYVPIEVVDRRREEGRNTEDADRVFRTYRCRGFPTLTITRPGSEQAFQAAGWSSKAATIEFLAIGKAKLEEMEKRGAREGKS